MINLVKKLVTSNFGFSHFGDPFAVFRNFGVHSEIHRISMNISELDSACNDSNLEKSAFNWSDQRSSAITLKFEATPANISSKFTLKVPFQAPPPQISKSGTKYNEVFGSEDLRDLKTYPFYKVEITNQNYLQAVLVILQRNHGKVANSWAAK